MNGEDRIPMRRVRITVIAFVLITSFSLTSSKSESCPYSFIFSFGDSLADTGNLYLSSPPLSDNCFFPPYGETFFHNVTGRCSDGRLIIDFIAEFLGIPSLKPYLEKRNIGGWSWKDGGANFAVSGATAMDSTFFQQRGIPVKTNYSLSVQLTWFKELLSTLCNSSSQSCSEEVKNSLFLVGEIGGNDFNHPLVVGKSIAEVKSYLPNVINTISSITKELIGLGAYTLMVPGNFPIGCSANFLTIYETKAEEQYDKFGCLKWLNEFTEYYNHKLQIELNKLQALHPHVNIIYVDYYNAAMTLYRHPANFGFIGLKACCGKGGPYNFNASIKCGDPGVKACDDPSKYIGWDGKHLTEAAYKLIVQALIKGTYSLPQFNSPCLTNANFGYTRTF
ncbi:hypothetical protein VIGAN_05051000 [Vigna angularis var. angularis]|uniref:Sinapine esterase n=1 Tax=Vigna angularis var. angularis TaxID=157739 RepID=A0A0S3S2Y4_PHAAN|nr:GDSL esterase/lipase At1g28570-like [Vigna angularis]BAT87167.1 hypothetical protein VIGAN_05051000 [Vigna angularis var. angularis]